MFCSKCGTQTPDGNAFCQACGAPLGTNAPDNAAYGAGAPNYSAPNNTPYGAGAPNYSAPNNTPYGAGAPDYSAPNNAPYGAGAPNNGVPNNTPFGAGVPNYGVPVGALPMNWHSFLTYFGLWAGAVINLIYGFVVMTGSHYGGAWQKALVYAFYGGLQAVDIFFGIALLGCAGLGFCTAIFLLQKKALGPTLLTVLYVVVAAASLIYCIAVASILSSAGVSSGDLIPTGIIQIIVSVVMIIVNRIYYGKRKDMFVN